MAEIVIKLKATGREGVMKNARRLSQLRNADAYPHTAKAVERLTRESQKVMLRAVQGNRVSWSGGQFVIHRITGGLHGSILGGLRYPFQGSKLKGGIEIKIKYYKFLRDGIKPYDMKPGLLNSPKAKISRRGIKYLIVAIPTSKHRFAARVFRIVTSRSKGWIHPGIAPMRLDKYTNEKMRDKASRVLREALKKDMGV
jgi:hypothetical protein